MKTNPWLAALSGFGFLALVLGLVLAILPYGAISSIGLILAIFGALLIVGWLVASALAWQLERTPAPRP